MQTQSAVKITITHPREFQETLDTAIDEAVTEGLRNPGHGVLVTRHDHQTFTVELSSDVQQGTITELDLRPSA